MVHRISCAGLIVLAGLLCSGSLWAGQDISAAFGRMPAIWGAKLSPDGTRLSMLYQADQDIPVLLTTTGNLERQVVLASKPGKFDIYWCDWANDERLLCGFYGIDRQGSVLFPVTRIVAVNADGSQQKVLLQRRLEEELFVQYQDKIVDWLPNDPEHVLIMMPETGGMGVSRLNVYTGTAKIEERTYQGSYDWISDGHGSARLRKYTSTAKTKWYYREPGKRPWQLLHERAQADVDAPDYFPIGFGQDRDKLLVFKPHDGRLALFAEDLANERRAELIFSHPEVDAWGYLDVGKHRRVAAVRYVTDRPRYHFFDERLEKVTRRVQATYPGKSIGIADESWDGTVYLVYIRSDTDPGGYHLYDLKQGSLMQLWPSRPAIDADWLGEMQTMSFTADDGTKVPGYLTLPPDVDGQKLPTVILPHSRLESRDIWDFDWLAQYFVARGYAVLQANFRGSGGYGDEWVGEGGFRQWRRTIGDLTDGVEALIEQGIADPQRICAVGWNYGGYAALMMAIERPDLYQCVASIAGVTDPKTLIEDFRNFLSKRAARAYVGTDSDVTQTGSPLKRAEEIRAPVLLFHGTKDLNVSVKHSRKLHRKLKNLKRNTRLVLYDDAEHGIRRNEMRIDMLDRLGKFLAQHIGP